MTKNKNDFHEEVVVTVGDSGLPEIPPTEDFDNASVDAVVTKTDTDAIVEGTVSISEVVSEEVEPLDEGEGLYNHILDDDEDTIDSDDIDELDEDDDEFEEIDDEDDDDELDSDLNDFDEIGDELDEELSDGISADDDEALEELSGVIPVIEGDITDDEDE